MKTSEILLPEILPGKEARQSSLNQSSHEKRNKKINKMPFIRAHVADHFNIKNNEFTGNFELDSVPMEDEHFNNVYLSCYDRYFEETGGRNLDKPSVITAIESEYTPTYNPVIDYLEKIKPRNSKGAIAELAATIETDTGMQDGTEKFYPLYGEVFIRKWLINMIATAINNTDNPLLLALLGKQGTGKTEWFRRLLPAELKAFYSEIDISDDKDFYIEMSKKLLIVDDELSGKSRVEMKSFKKIMSKQDINVRVPYGRKAKLMKRRASLAGTGNELTILYDYTGNRRIIPIHVLSINHDKYNSIDKADVFSEAYNAFLNEEDFRLTRSDMDMLTGSTEEFNYIDYESDLVDRYLIPGSIEGDTDNEYRYSSGEVVELLSKVTTQKIIPIKIGFALSKYGYEKGQCRKKESTKLVRYAIHPASPIFKAIREQELGNLKYSNNWT